MKKQKKELDEIQKKQKDLYDSFFKCLPQECTIKLNEDLDTYKSCIPQKCDELPCVYCEEYYACIPQECQTKKTEAYDKYENCIPQDCKDKNTKANDFTEQINLLDSTYRKCVFDNIDRPYPDIIEHTCRTWQGNSGGGFVSQDGKIYGVCSFGAMGNAKKAFFDKEDFMASSWQFEKKVKELREIYSTQNTPNENLKKIPKNIVVENQTDNTETNLSNIGLEKSTYSKLAYKEDDEEDEEYTKEEMAELITTRKQELLEKNTEILNQIKQSKKFNLNEKLQLLGEITEYSVKSERLEELQKAYEEAKANEQSLANRTLTALTVAATGIGGMELARGLAEQRADKEAEQDMAAYISTFRCTYGDGHQVKAGPEEIELPGANDETMMALRQEYFALAKDLKERKEALGMAPGIESEEIMDKSQMGLYDDENIGISSGAYASLYRAKALESEEDKTKIEAEQSASKKRVIGGGVAAGVGTVGGVVGNGLINGFTPENTDE